MRLKPIPTNTVVHTPTEEEARELFAILHENGWISTGSENYVIKNAEGIQIESETIWSWWEKIENARKANRTILTLAEFKRLYCEEEKPQPKFKVGDKAVMATNKYDIKGIVGSVCEITEVLPHGYHLKSPTGYWYAMESDLEPYTEPETKPTEDMETKELNLCELLKGHEGGKFYSLAHGEVTLDHVSPTIDSCIVVKKRNGGEERFYRNGRWLRYGVVMLFPSRALYEQYPLDPLKAWMKWQEEQNIKCRIWLSIETKGERTMPIKGFDTIFRTPADRDKCIGEIQSTIEKYSKK
jgi:hypothetical protein